MFTHLHAHCGQAFSRHSRTSWGICSWRRLRAHFCHHCSLLLGVPAHQCARSSFLAGGLKPLRVPTGMLSDMQSNTFLETILLKELVKRILNCLSFKMLCHIHKTEAAKFHFPMSRNLALFVNTGKVGDVYVQQVIGKVVLFVLSGKPQWYPSKPGYYFRERRPSQTFPKHALLIDVTWGKEWKGFMVKWVWEKLDQIFFKGRNKFFCCGISHGFHYGDVYYESLGDIACELPTIHLRRDSFMVSVSKEFICWVM